MKKLVVYNGDTAYYYPCSDPRTLEKGKTYEVVSIAQSSWHTEYKLNGIEGEFNSIWFDEVTNNIELAFSEEIPVVGKRYRCKKIKSEMNGITVVPMYTSTVQHVSFIDGVYIVKTVNSVYCVKIN